MRTSGCRKLNRNLSESTSIGNAFEFLFKNASDAIFILDSHGRVITVNRTAEKLTGKKRDHFVGKSLDEIVPRKVLGESRKNFGDVIKGKPARFELRLTAANGEPFQIEVTSMPCMKENKVVAVLGIVRDITARKQVEERLRESEERYRSLAESLPEAVYTIDRHGTIRSLNAAFERLTGWSRRTWIGKSFTGLVHPDDRSLAIKTFRAALRGRTSKPYELRIHARNGQYLKGEFMSRPYVEDDKIIGEFGIVRDVTERSKAEEALRFSEAKYRMLFENVPDGVYQSTPEGKIITANPALVHMLGYASADELRALSIGRDLYVNPMEREAWTQKLNKEKSVRNAELVLLRKDGQKLIALENSRAVRDKKGKVSYYEGTIIDITERKELEDRLSALNFYGGKINAAQNIQQVYSLTLDALEKTLGVENTAFLRCKRERLETVCLRGHPQELSGFSLAERRGITVKAARTRKPVLVKDVRKCKDYIEGTSGMRSELAVPVMLENRLLGVLNVESKELSAFDERDIMLLQILASHAATSISNLEKREEIEKRSAQLASLMKNCAGVIHIRNLRQQLRKIAEAIVELGWRRVVIRAVRDENLDLDDPSDLVTAGLTKEEREFLWNNRVPGQVWRDRFGPEFERFRIGEFYHLPWSDPWVRKRFSQGTVESKLSQKDMIDWDPQDLLYAPLRLPDGRIVGVLSIDDPLDGKRPTKESLVPFELFIHQAAVAIENVQLFEQLESAKNQIKRYAENLEEKVRERTEDLRRSEDKLRSIITASPSSVIATDENGDIIECNEQTLKMHDHLSKEELIGKSLFRLIAEKDRQRANDALKKTLEKGPVRDLEFTFVTKDGREFPAELSASVVKDVGGKPVSYVAITSDITERKHMEEQLLRSERLAAIGEVAAMVGHDLRNPLTGIAGATYYLKTKLGPNEDKRKKEMLELIERDIEYSNKIIDDLLEYSREIRLELAPCPLDTIVAEASLMARIPASIRVLDLTRDVPKATVDRQKLTRVFLNIVRNACEAMPEGGALTIENRNHQNHVDLIFSDTGSGMAEPMLKRIFTPLFTTKAKGMGFGLAICRRIVEAHGGRIIVKSEVGKGTVFTVTIPTSQEIEGGEKIWVNAPESLSLTTTRA